jgi:hypothetical protein
MKRHCDVCGGAGGIVLTDEEREGAFRSMAAWIKVLCGKCRNRYRVGTVPRSKRMYMRLVTGTDEPPAQVDPLDDAA